MINQKSFGARLPQIDDRRLPDVNSQAAYNCDFRDGTLKASAGLTTIQEITGVSNPSTIRKLGSTWIAWDADVDTAVRYVSDAEVLCYTGDSYPKQINETLYGAASFRRLGVVPPATAPTVGLQSNGGSDSNLQATVSYCYTYVTEWGEESAPSPVTAGVDVTNSQWVQLSGLVAPNTNDANNNNNVVATRFYRLETTTTGASYMFLEEVADETAATYNDSDGGSPAMLQDTEDTVIQTTYWALPPNDLAGLCEFTSGMFAGFSDNYVYFTEPYVPYAWPTSYVLTFDSPIVAIVPFNEMLIVMSQKSVDVVTGVDPEALTKVPLPGAGVCVSKNSVVANKDGVYYMGNNGLIFTDGVTPTVVTSGIYTKEQWLALAPSTYAGFMFDNVYHGFRTELDEGIIISDVGVTDMDLVEHIHGGTILPNDDKLYLITETNGTTFYIKTFGTGSSLTYTWTSKKYDMTFPSNYSRGIIEASGAVTLTTYGDDVIVSGPTAVTPANAHTPAAFRLPGMKRYQYFHYRLTGTSEVFRVAFGNTRRELVNG